MINISFQTKSPLCQISTSEDTSIKIKKQKVLVENKHGRKTSLYVPIYTGNGFRGMLRRETMAVMLEAYAKNSKSGEKIMASPEDYHLMNAGGGNAYPNQPFNVEDKVRELNPQISLFGASLAVKGKIRVSNFVPFEKNENSDVFYQFYESQEGHVFSSIIGESKIVVRDGILDRNQNSQYLTREQIEDWLEKNDTNTKERAKDRESDEKNTKKKTMRGLVTREYVAVGVDFFGGISEIEKLTIIEKGLLVLGLERAILNNLGAVSSNDFGKVKYTIEIDKDSKLETDINKYGQCTISSRYYSEELEKCLKETQKFLKNISKETFDIAKLLIKN